MKLYNTLTKNIEDFIPWEEENVKMYTCGPTVYGYAHIGNLRTYIMEDILEKALIYLGYNVKRVMNITDVGHLVSDADTGEDKMLVTAKKEHKKVLEIAKYYTEAFFGDCEKLNIKKPEIVSNATDNINEFITIIEKLIDSGYAYISGGNVYFDTSKLEKYYTLSNHNSEENFEAVRESVEIDTNKKNKNDFVLWFTKSKFDDQDLKWESPFGLGYPGWHIECTGISLKYLGEKLDIHCGGIDNIFPHHTNEIAQSEAYTGQKWCKYWVHGEHLNDSSGKISKSKGTKLTVGVLEEKGYNPLEFRFMCLMSHYRNQLVFSYESLDGLANAYKKLKLKVLNLNIDTKFDKEDFDLYNDKFKKYLEDDLNTASIITLIYDVLKSDISEHTKYKLIESFDKVLSLDLTKIITTEIQEDYILEQIELRNKAKENKDYELADKIRDDLLAKNIVLKDSRERTTYEVKI